MTTFAVAAEDRLAAFVSTTLIRALRQDEPEFVGLDGHAGYSDAGAVKRLAETARVRVHPRGLGGRKALAYKCVRLADAEEHARLVLAFDADGEPGALAEGVAHAQSSASSSVRVVIVEPQPEFDAWVVAGAQPTARHQLEAHKAICARLNFDPIRHPHRLTSTVNGDPRDAKEVCQELLGLDEQAGEQPEVETCVRAVELLRANAARAGFAEFEASLQRA